MGIARVNLVSPFRFLVRSKYAGNCAAVLLHIHADESQFIVFQGPRWEIVKTAHAAFRAVRIIRDHVQFSAGLVDSVDIAVRSKIGDQTALALHCCQQRTLGNPDRLTDRAASGDQQATED